MITLAHTIAGDDCRIYMPERRQDLPGFHDFLAQGDKVLGLDTETTGLGIYEREFGTRLVQIGNAREAWVLRVDLFADEIRKALRQARHFVVHNAAYDLQVIDRTLGVKIEELASRVFDTKIFAHLLDPRMKSEGGAGLRLKELSEIYVDDTAPDTEEGLSAIFSKLFSEWKKTVSKETIETFIRKNGNRPHIPFGFANIKIDHELYVRYAGLDVILVTRLFYELAPIIKDLGLNDLSKFEHHLQGLLCLMQRKGMKLDVGYIHELREDLIREHDEFAMVAKRYGVENINSTDQVAAALIGMGETLTETTDSGKWKVDKAVLSTLADLDREWERIEAREPNPLADAVMRAKRASKWQTSYVDAFLDFRDEDDRLHASINGLQARTARMSVSRPPLQQLPSGDFKIRRAVVADPGHVMISSDYDQIELRVLAALADVKAMKKAIAEGIDLHGYTAELIYGPEFTKFHRKLSKGTGFGKVYGGGAVTLARQTGADMDSVKHAIAEYDRVYPEIKRYSKKLQSRAEFGKKEVITVSGRHLPLDRDRLYSATNYVIQSTARDILAQAIVDLFDAGLGDYLLLPIHDELLAQAPAEDADDVARELGRIMSGMFYGVPLSSTGEVTGRNWGAAYGADKLAGIW
ncbi:DNA polymerase I [Arthrobacter phage DrManhattan]|uniref:DNA polymerase n=1 Tax=Arthrobacter phage DrManhattan TaxID=2419955 RepID=A0A3G2KFM5_9CAUD|nr:DNA polymerase I [Arthrobacter phage DrManhattan]AYN57760.1 DNA polymerase I [Arthrobacter phage DrManhattan]